MSAEYKIFNTNLVDVVNGKILENVDIHVSKGKIIEISPFVNEIEEYRGQENIDATGLWAIPGLIDSHAHLIEDFDPNTSHLYRVDEDFEKSLARAEKNIIDALSIGVTTIRDVGAFDARNNIIRNIVDQNIEKYKFRVVSCGRHITVAHGHRAATGVVWDEITDLRTIVAREISLGADLIKVMNDDVIFDKKLLGIISDTCHEMGKKLACHAFTPQSIEIALEANADTIEHGYPTSNDMAIKMANQNVFLCPTLVAAHDSIFDINAQSAITNAFPDCSIEEFNYWYNQLTQFLPLAFKHNVKVITGTDAGTPPTNFRSLPREIILMADIGASNCQALQAATINGAIAVGLEKTIGSLEVEKSADIVLLRSDPLKDIKAAIKSVHTVISRGYLVYTSGY